MEMSFFEAIKQLYINPDLIIKRKSWEDDKKIHIDNIKNSVNININKIDIVSNDWILM